jgi:hypothetical protein
MGQSAGIRALDATAATVVDVRATELCLTPIVDITVEVAVPEGDIQDVKVRGFLMVSAGSGYQKDGHQ